MRGRGSGLVALLLFLISVSLVLAREEEEEEGKAISMMTSPISALLRSLTIGSPSLSSERRREKAGEREGRGGGKEQGERGREGGREREQRDGRRMIYGLLQDVISLFIVVAKAPIRNQLTRIQSFSLPFSSRFLTFPPSSLSSSLPCLFLISTIHSCVLVMYWLIFSIFPT
jgi:hypothetical protein